METPAVSLAGRAAELSTSLFSLGERCGHNQTSGDISNIAGELSLLSTTLWRLHEAMVITPDEYTTAFHDDLGEISFELALVFDEVDECCTAMQKSDTPTTTTVGWFFKKGRVRKLQTHLEALKTTLVVMKTVLHHGKEYGVQKYVPATLPLVSIVLTQSAVALLIDWPSLPPTPWSRIVQFWSLSLQKTGPPSWIFMNLKRPQATTTPLRLRPPLQMP